MVSTKGPASLSQSSIVRQLFGGQPLQNVAGLGIENFDHHFFGVLVVVEARVKRPRRQFDLLRLRPFLRALVAIARKLAVILHRMWIDATPFSFSQPEAPT